MMATQRHRSCWLFTDIRFSHFADAFTMNTFCGLMGSILDPQFLYTLTTGRIVGMVESSSFDEPRSCSAGATRVLRMNYVHAAKMHLGEVRPV